MIPVPSPRHLALRIGAACSIHAGTADLHAPYRSVFDEVYSTRADVAGRTWPATSCRAFDGDLLDSLEQAA